VTSEQPFPQPLAALASGVPKPEAGLQPTLAACTFRGLGLSPHQQTQRPAPAATAEKLPLPCRKAALGKAFAGKRAKQNFPCVQENPAQFTWPAVDTLLKLHSGGQFRGSHTLCVSPSPTPIQPEPALHYGRHNSAQYGRHTVVGTMKPSLSSLHLPMPATPFAHRRFR
jgi:hypothetical protein